LVAFHEGAVAAGLDEKDEEEVVAAGLDEKDEEGPIGLGSRNKELSCSSSCLLEFAKASPCGDSNIIS
jgi:hypothetical protein